MASPARSRWILAAVLLAVIGGVWWVRHKQPILGEAYIGDRTAILWSTTAQVRQTVATLHYGDHVLITRRAGDQTEVQTAAGARGWIDAHELMEPALWKGAADLLAKAREMPVQAAGHMRALSNVHIEPGRDSARIFQLGRNLPVAVLARKAAEGPATPETPPDGAAAPSDAEQRKQEEWLLVLRTGTGSSSAPNASGSAPDAGDTPVAGWVLAQFVELDPPPPIGDYASSSGLRVVAWVLLNRAAGPDAKPQYVVAGTHGAARPECDFTALRVYTWDEKRERYETAYIENDLCGSLPIRVRPISAGAEFTFPERDQGGAERGYRMQMTSVRRVQATGISRH
jgi:hypothetical protein